jgi:hypothetical protein
MCFLSFEFYFGVLLNYHTIRRDNMGGQLWPRPPCSGMLSIVASQNDIYIIYSIYIYVMLFCSYEFALEDDDLGLPQMKYGWRVLKLLCYISDNIIKQS